jgi:hypothetical protein
MERARWLFLTYAQSSIGDETEFEARLKAKLAEAQVFRHYRRYGRRKEHVASRFCGVHETRQQRQDEVTCPPLHRYQVLVLFDDRVGFEDDDHVKATFEIGDGSMMKVDWSRGEMRWHGEVPPTDKQEREFAKLVHQFIEREVSTEGVERCLFGTRFDVDEEFRLVEEQRVARL